MSESGTSASGGSFASSAGGSSMASDNTDTRALNSMHETPEGEAGDDFGNSKSIQEGVFATLYTLTKNKAMDTSLRIAALRIVLEFLQFFRIIFNFSFPWFIDRESGAFKAVEWVLIRALVVTKGYDMYVMVFYVIAAVILVTLVLTVWVALVLKGSDSVNPWLRKLIGALQLLALVVFCIAWPVLLDYVSFLFDCQWTNLAHGSPPAHIYFSEQSCTAMPHLAHMLFAAVILVLLVGMVLLMGVGSTCDMNPLNASRLSSSDEVTTIKMLALKIIFVILATVLDQFSTAQAGIMTVAMWGVTYYLFDGVPYYNRIVNFIFGGLWFGILNVTIVLLVTRVTIHQYTDPVAFIALMTKVMLYSIFPAILGGAALMWLRLWRVDRVSRALHNSFNVCKAGVLANIMDEGQRNSGNMVSLMGDLKKVYRFRDVRQVKILCRAMRKWDEDGQPDGEAIELGEFLIKCGMARMPNNPSLLVMYASFLIEARKDGQASRTQLQLAQKASPSLLDNYTIYVTQQLAKQLKRDGDGLDLMSYVEFQRNYLACVRAHKAALMTQRTFWNSLLKDNISFRDLQANVQAMEVAEQRATSIYRRVMERYPGNGKVMKVYGRFLEIVRAEPGAAARYYEAALKAGTSESLLALTAAEGGAAGLSAAGQIDEKVDGLAVINAQGTIMMVNNACLGMFGYLKGELEGKNVSVLMPQPMSSRHDSFLQRYAETGAPHILNKTRAVVALHKDRHMFPLSLCVARLSGVGTDTLFIGVMRHEATASTADNQIVKLYATAAGVILCADSSMADAFGIPAGDLVGRCFSNLCTDVEGANRYLATATQTVEVVDESGVAAAGPTFTTKMLHAFLPPVDVELSVQFGGHTETGSDFRSIILHVRVLNPPTAVMVVDHKGRILHATAKLSSLLGHPVLNLVKMELNQLLPQPICQMHGAWFKDPSLRIPATSCRAGSVVHLLAANGTKVPVTLKLTTKEDTTNGHTTHVVQVTKATEDQRLDQHRMLLGINHRGNIVSVNAGASRSLFSFEGQQLVGQPLSSAIDIFTDWKQGHGEELSLLELLVGQLMASDPAATKVTTVCASWRVGVHRPAASGHADQPGATTGLHGSLLHALQPNRVQPACMKLEPVAQEPGELLSDGEAADSVPILQVALHRSDALTTVMDLDHHLNVARADDAAGLMFGVNARQLHHMNFARLVGLHDVKHFDDLLGKTGAKKGAMKSAAAASRAGTIRKVVATHLGDGQPLTLQMQAMSYDQAGRSRNVVRLQLVNPVSAAMEKLLTLKEGMQDSKHGGDAELEGSHKAESLPSNGDSRRGSSKAGSDIDEPEPTAHPAGRKDRIRDWVRQASNLDAYDDNDNPDESLKCKNPQKSRLGQGYPDADGEVHMRIPVHHKSMGKDTFKPAAKAMLSDSDSNEDGSPLAKGMPPRIAPNRHISGDAGSEAGESCGGSMADGMSDAGSAIESSVAAGGMGHDEELAVDMRRAKRLKKLSRMMSSSLAQAASNKWKQHTIYVLSIILVAHVACFAVIVTQIEARHANAVSVNNIAMSMSSASQSVLRINFMHKCALPEFAHYLVCQPSTVADYGERLNKNTKKFRQYHQALFLGGDGLKPFSDPRLVNFWTYEQLAESVFYEVLEDGLPAFKNSTRTLWEMGNVLLAALEDVYYFRNDWGQDMDRKPVWQYAYLNGPASIFTGYAWSLDTFVDYTWQDLTKLSVIIIVLLVVEALIVQMSCMAYEFYLLQKCNVSHMRLFSVFLALPSATVRFMVRQPIIVDDNGPDDVDDDDLDLAEGAAAGGQNAGAAAAQDGDAATEEKKSVSKSVRLAADDDGEEDKGKTSAKVKVDSAKFKGVTKNSKPPIGGWAGFKKRMIKSLFGWMDPRIKRNGKKLMPSSRVIWRFMAPLLLWVAAVMVIYGVSYSNLQGLQGPLASLDLSAHVMYRLTRARLTANLLAFSVDDASNSKYKRELKEELGLLREEYSTLLYGGPMRLQAAVSFNPVAPAAVLQNSELADIFFKTTSCLRADTSTCFDETDSNYKITHSGLDAQMNRYMDEMFTFANLPDAMALANATSYEWVCKVTARDTYEGLQKASDLFVAGTLSKLEGVKQLHIILLAISLCALVMFVLALYRPYIKALRRDTKAVVNMLSQLPAEVDVEGQVKSIVLGITKTDGGKSMEGLTPGPHNQMQPYGMGAGMTAGAGMRNGWGINGVGPPRSDGGWFGRSNNGPQMQANDPRIYGYGMQSGVTPGMQYGGDMA